MPCQVSVNVSRYVNNDTDTKAMINCYLLTSPSLISATASMKRPEGFDGGTEPICRFSSHLLNPPRNESCGRED